MLLKLPEVFSKDEVREIRDSLSRVSYVEQKKTKESGGETAGLVKNNLQAPVGHPEVRPSAEMVSKRLAANPQFGIFALPKKMHMMFNRYEAGMFYETHVDSAIMMHRPGELTRTDLAFTVFLSEPKEYQGGDFLVQLEFGEARIREPAGNVIVYQADTLHGVEQVTQGARWAVVGWIESFISDPVEREIHYELSVAIKDAQEVVDTDLRRRFERVHERLVRRWVKT
jgi:PKHD-type hydroxylase